MENIQESTIDYAFLVTNFIKEYLVNKGFILHCSESEFYRIIEFKVGYPTDVEITWAHMNIPKYIENTSNWTNHLGEHKNLSISCPTFFNQLTEFLIEPLLKKLPPVRPEESIN